MDYPADRRSHHRKGGHQSGAGSPSHMTDPRGGDPPRERSRGPSPCPGVEREERPRTGVWSGTPMSSIPVGFQEEGWDMGPEGRPRVASMPTRGSPRPALKNLRASGNVSPPNTLSPPAVGGGGGGEVHRVRSFTITPKGVVNKGRKVITRSSTSLASSCNTGSPEGEEGPHSPTQAGPGAAAAGGHPHPGHGSATAATLKAFRVLLLGSEGVGKRALIREFVEPDNNSSAIFYSSWDDEADKAVSIVLDGEESTIEFVDVSDREVDEALKAAHIDAYVVVYSVEDRRSFEAAIDRLYEIREEEGRHVTVILVANKADLVRSRVVPEDEGRAAASTYDSKYIEVSAAIDHKIDDLLVGIVKQIRLVRKKQDKKLRSRWKSGKMYQTLDSCCLLRAHNNMLTKLFKGQNPTSRSCDNLYVL